MTRSNDDKPKTDRTGDEPAEATTAPPAGSAIEPTAVQAAQEADRRDDLPDADTDTKETGGSSSGRRRRSE